MGFMDEYGVYGELHVIKSGVHQRHHVRSLELHHLSGPWFQDLADLPVHLCFRNFEIVKVQVHPQSLFPGLYLWVYLAADQEAPVLDVFQLFLDYLAELLHLIEQSFAQPALFAEFQSKGFPYGTSPARVVQSSRCLPEEPPQAVIAQRSLGELLRYLGLPCGFNHFF
jgi:hypothetical protein